MSKILATQLNGLFQKIAQNEEEAIEETARLLAQASIGKVMFILPVSVNCKLLNHML